MTDNADEVDQVVAGELARYRKQVGRELTAEEIEQIHRSPTMHGWLRFCKANHEHNSVRLRAQGWTLSEGDFGVWVRKQ
jgi:hypothetical protein